MSGVWVLSLGGSLIAPDAVDEQFVSGFCAELRRLAQADAQRRFVVVCGGGAPARAYQRVYRQLATAPRDEHADWIGIAATRLNAELIRQLLGDLVANDVVTDPTTVTAITGTMLVAAGWKPGFSHDYDAVVIAQQLGADTIVKLSNVDGVYSADPRRDSSARSFDHMRWAELQALTGDTWQPGHHAPFDPIATKAAAADGMTLIVASGDLANLNAIVSGAAYAGTTVGPD